MSTFRGLGYADAVRLLGGKDNGIVTALDKITGGILLGAAVGLPALLGWFEARAEFARLSQDLVRFFSERRTGLSRYSRTERLEAAHSVLVVSAFFQAFARADLPFKFTELQLTKAEQVSMATSGSNLAATATRLAEALLNISEGALPHPQESHDRYLEFLKQRYYPNLCQVTEQFIMGLAVWDRLSETDQDRFTRALKSIPARALSGYEELFRRLAADFPEVAFWASMREHQATQTQVGSLGLALSNLELLLSQISTGRLPGEQRAALTRAYQADLLRPIVESGDIPEGLMLPALGQAYIAPLFKAGSIRSGGNPGDEAWWEHTPIRHDLDEFFAGYLTSPQATRAPLLVLGQPGSGKSVLTRVLAARLPPQDFLPIRVLLREVSAQADLQEQVEQAIRIATGERLDWPDLVRSAGDALPVIILDGFDELLQATGVSQSDYLSKVTVFQQRESAQQRPVAVIVTTRTSVADRARIPEESVALRLEPFEPARIRSWLEIWNTLNAEYFHAHKLQPLSPQAVLYHRELARQPLLLLMLALYDATDNALQQIPVDLRQDELYERLLRRFAGREIQKHQPSLPDRDLDREIEQELRRLSIVAFAMFNRGSLWVTEADLNDDLVAILGQPSSPTAHDLRASLSAAEVVLGRFFFIHRAQATRDDGLLEAYEFLHATFGEFLIARFIEQILGDIAARDTVSSMHLAGGPPDDDLIHTLLSFRALCTRTSIIGFLALMMEHLTDSERDTRARLLKHLIMRVNRPRSGRHFYRYEPAVLSVPARCAAYGANLMLLVVCVAGSVRASEFFDGQSETVTEWHRQALLMRSQLSTEEWVSLVETLTVDRIWVEGRRDIRLRIDHGSASVPAIDPNWTYESGNTEPTSWWSFSDTERAAGALRSKANFLCGINDDVVSHILEPLAATLPETVSVFVGGFPDLSLRSAANALLDTWLLPVGDRDQEERRAVYERCVAIATGEAVPSWFLDSATREKYAILILDRLATDIDVPPTLAADILSSLGLRGSFDLTRELATRIVTCSLAFLGCDRESDNRLSEVLIFALKPGLGVVATSAGLEAWVRLAELGFPIPTLREEDSASEFQDLLRSVARRRPDLASRAQRVKERRA